MPPVDLAKYTNIAYGSFAGSTLTGIRYVWQGRNRWCEDCFWGHNSEGAVSDVPTDFDTPEKENTKENTDVDR